MPKYVVGEITQFPPSSRTRVRVAGHDIAIFNVEGTLRALLDRCPHQGASLAAGYVCGALRSSGPGKFEYDATRTLVRCPWHGWEYDLETGQSWTDPKRHRVKPYPVGVERGEAVVSGLEPAADGFVPGPYVAETVPVTIDREYVVVELG